MITVYGIKNCDTCRKALKWLAAEGIEHKFHDFRVDGLEASSLSGWVKTAGWEKLLNRRGTTWRKLSDAEKGGVDEAKAETLMAGNPTLIKRPVFETGEQVLVGFSADEQAALKA
jgi:arsenate reductase (glutaredoxin)